MLSLIFLVIVDMCFAIQKKELINLKNTIDEVQKNKKMRWVLDFSIVKLVSIWEKIIRDFCDEELLKIGNNNDIKVSFDKKRFYEYVWKSWRDGKQQNLTNEKINLECKDVKKYSEIRNKVVHGNSLTDSEKATICTMNNETSLLNKTLKILETYEKTLVNIHHA